MQDLGIRILFDGQNLIRLLGGLWVTVRISLVSVALSMGIGIGVGFIMNMRHPLVRAVTRLYLEFIRIMPQLVLLFLVYFGLSGKLGINLTGETAAILVFTLWGVAEMGDLVRSAIQSIPRHQYESGSAVGLTKIQIYFYIIMPQAVRRLLPLAINLITRMIKTTSLVVLIGVVEVVKIGQQIAEANRFTQPNAAIWIYGFIFLLYFIVCYPISRLSLKLEKKWG